MSIKAPILELRPILNAFWGFRALRDFNFEMRPGGIHAPLGPHGTGKSALIGAGGGFTTLDIGGVHRIGNDIKKPVLYDRIPLGLVHTFQGVRSFAKLAMLENIRFGAHCHGPAGPGDFISHRNHFKGRKNVGCQGAIRLTDSVGLTGDNDLFFLVFPVGKQHLVGLTPAAGLKPALIFLDELGAGLGQEEKPFMVADLIAPVARKLRYCWTSIKCT